MTDHSGTQLEEIMSAAMAGDRNASLAFFKLLIEGPLFVPERFQKQPLSDSPKYPNDFVNVLGIKDGDRVIVPAFSRPEMIEAWCGSPLSYKQLSGKEFATLVPEDWWACLNPGCEVEKELSPWELSELKMGHEAVAALSEELNASFELNPVELRPLKAGEFEEVKQKLLALAEAIPELTRLFLVVQVEQKASEKSENGIEEKSSLFVGLELRDDARDKVEPIKKSLHDALMPHFIGDDGLRIIAGTVSDQSPMLGLVRVTTPLIEREHKGQIWSAIKKLLKF